jgi:SP family xylose:H+ symportor-like MFS transporter
MRPLVHSGAANRDPSQGASADRPGRPSTDECEGEGSFGYLVLACCVATLGGLLFGYDTAVISGAIGFLQAHFSLSPAAVGWAASCALLGCVIGAASAGWLSDRLGRRTVLLLCAILFLVSAIGTALPATLSQFVLFRVIGGIAVGAASLTSPMYIAEISPARIRGRMVSLNQFAIIFGMVAVYFVNYFIAARGSESWNVQYGWRWMFGSGALPALALLILLFLVPESPRWLAERQGDAALSVLTRINGGEQARRELAAIQQSLGPGGASIQQLFAPEMRIALLVGIALAVFQQVTGINVFLYYAPEIFKTVSGSATGAALLQTVVVGAVNLTFTVVAIWTVDRLGRRPLMKIGFTGMGLSLLGLGAAAYYQRTDVWVLTFILGYIASFALSVGPVTWVILSEIFPTRIRGRAMGIATVLLWIANFVVSQTFPMLDQNRWLVDRFHHAFPFWLYAVLCLAAILFVTRYVPETRGRSLEEVEHLWQAPSPAVSRSEDVSCRTMGGQVAGGLKQR